MELLYFKRKICLRVKEHLSNRSCVQPSKVFPLVASPFLKAFLFKGHLYFFGVSQIIFHQSMETGDGDTPQLCVRTTLEVFSFM